VRALLVPGPRQARDRVQEDQHVVAVFHHALGLFQDHLGDLDVAGRRLVEGGADHLAVLAFDLALHVGDFFGPLVHQEHEDVQLRVIGQRGLGHFLHEDRLAGPRRADDQPPLPETHRHDHVADAGFDAAGRVLHDDPLARMHGREVVEVDLAGQEVRVLVVDRLHAQQGEVALVFLGRPDLAGDRGPGPQPEAADLAGRDVDVVRAGEVVVLRAAQEAEAVGQDLQRSLPVHQPVHSHPLFEDAEDQILALDAGDVGEIVLAGLFDQLAHGHFLQLGDRGVAGFLDLLVALVELFIDHPVPVGQLFGQGQGLGLFLGREAGRFGRVGRVGRGRARGVRGPARPARGT